MKIIYIVYTCRWEYAAIDKLPEYMKLCYKSLLDTTNQNATTIYENHGYNPINILKQTVFNY